MRVRVGARSGPVRGLVTARPVPTGLTRAPDGCILGPMSTDTVRDARPIGGVQSVWLHALASGPHCSGLDSAGRRCLEALERRGLVERRRPGAWYITDAGRRASRASRIIAPRPRAR